MKFIRELLEQQKKMKKQQVGREGAKSLNDTLRQRGGGAHYSPKKDYVRAKEKQKYQRDVVESLDRFDMPVSNHQQPYFFRYTLRYQDNNNRDVHVMDVIRAPSKRDAEVQLKRAYPGTYSVSFKEISQEEFEQYRQRNN